MLINEMDRKGVNYSAKPSLIKACDFWNWLYISNFVSQQYVIRCINYAVSNDRIIFNDALGRKQP
jgi:hypothetical protein